MLYVYLTLVLAVGIGLGFWVRKKTYRLPPGPEPLPNVIYVERFEPTLLPLPEPEVERLPEAEQPVGTTRRIHLSDSRRTRLSG